MLNEWVEDKIGEHRRKVSRLHSDFVVAIISDFEIGVDVWPDTAGGDDDGALCQLIVEIDFRRCQAMCVAPGIKSATDLHRAIAAPGR